MGNFSTFIQRISARWMPQYYSINCMDYYYGYRAFELTPQTNMVNGKYASARVLTGSKL